jgi:2-polyprenyl-6-methoxyphenol hydroxylase-like FAD-dependent oxidoreductase
MSEVPALIVGGGIGGLATAIALRHIGVEALVIERAPVLSEIGAGLLLSPNACRVLEILGVVEELRISAIETPCWELLDQAGRSLANLNIAVAGEHSLSTRRSDLQAVLLKALPSAAIRTESEAVSARDCGSHVEVSLTDGSVLRAERVIAADGANSALRRHLWPERVLGYRGYVGWRGIVEGYVPEGWESGRVTESWGKGRRFGIGHVGGGRTYWYATANRSKAEKNIPTSLECLRDDFASWHEPVGKLLGRMDPAGLLQHPIYDSRPHWHWRRGERIALLGDAAHPLTPNLGQGAAMALEDALALAKCWKYPDALARYERCRRGRLFAILTASRCVGAMIQWEHPLLCGVRDFQLRWTPDALARAALRALLVR